MTATTDIIGPEAIALEPVRMADGGRMIVRAVQRLFGAALTLAAVGIWVSPGSSWDADLILFKLVLSLVALIAGVALMQSSASPAQPEVEIDTIRREVRLVRGVAGRKHILDRCAFGNLAAAEMEGNHVRMFGADQKLLAEVTLTDRKMLNSLTAGLRDAGKLT